MSPRPRRWSSQDAAGLPRPRAAVAGEGPGARRFSRHDRHRPAEGPGHEAAALQPHPRAAWPAPRSSISSTRWCCGRRRRPSTVPTIIGHFGLNLRRYAHFTSPIRRYADLIVHRALITRAARQGEDGLSPQDIEPIGDTAEHHLRRRAPRHGGRARHRRPLIAASGRRRSARCSPAKISGVTRAGLFVSLE